LALSLMKYVVLVTHWW